MSKVATVALYLAAVTLFTGCATGSGSSKVENDKRLAADAYKQGKFQEAGGYYLKILKSDEKDVEALFRLGNINAKNNQPKVAVRFYEKALLVKSDFAPAWRNLAVVRLRQGLAAMLESQSHLSDNDPLYTSNVKIINELVKVPGLDNAGANSGKTAAQAKGVSNESR